MKMSQSLSELEHRLTVLEAKDAINTLMYEYLHACDVSENPAEIADFFTADATYEAGGNLAEIPPVTGRKGLQELFGSVRSILSYSTHFASNPVISVESNGTSAFGRWYTYEMATTASPEEQIILLATYENDFTLTGDGWKIQKIRFSDILSFPYSEGWRDVRFISLVNLERKGHSE
jgi:hypothetical protein